MLDSLMSEVDCEGVLWMGSIEPKDSSFMERAQDPQYPPYTVKDLASSWSLPPIVTPLLCHLLALISQTSYFSLSWHMLILLFLAHQMLRNIFWFSSHYLVSRLNSPFLCPQLRASPPHMHLPWPQSKDPFLTRGQYKYRHTPEILWNSSFLHFPGQYCEEKEREREGKRGEGRGGKFNQLFVIPPCRPYTGHGWIRYLLPWSFPIELPFGGHSF